MRLGHHRREKEFVCESPTLRIALGGRRGLEGLYRLGPHSGSEPHWRPVRAGEHQPDQRRDHVRVLRPPPLYTNNGVPPMLIEQGDYNCSYNSQAGYAADPNCFKYPASTWITEYWVIHIGIYGQPNTSFQARIAPAGQPLKRFINLPNFTFGDGSDHTAGLHGIILQPYFSGANGSTSTPAATMWFDDLIISTQPIAAPNN